MTIAIGNDHAGTEYKQQIKKEVDDIKFHYKILDCYKEMNEYIKEKYLPIGQKINSNWAGKSLLGLAQTFEDQIIPSQE